MEEKLEGVALIVTGRMADSRVIEEAHPLTETKGIKQKVELRNEINAKTPKRTASAF